MTRRLLVIGFALSLVGGHWFAPPASARTQGDIGPASPSNRVIEREFLPFPAVYPIQVEDEETHPFGNFKPAACRDPSDEHSGHGSAYCDFLEFTVDIPDDYREVYGVGIVLEWDNPYHPDTNATGNQLTLHVWADDDPALGGPLGPCRNPKAKVCQGQHPLFFRMVEPLPSTGDVTCPATDCNRYPILMTVVNAKNVNVGYKITIHFFELELPPIPEFADDRFDPLPTQTTEDKQDTGARENLRAEDLGIDPRSGNPGERPKILVPGPDGELIELDFPGLAAGRLEPDEGRRVNPFITAGIVIPLLATLVVMLVRRRRRAA